MKLFTAFSVLALTYGRDASSLRGSTVDRDLQAFSVTSLKLINTNTNTPLATLTGDATINVPSGTGLNIMAEVTGSVRSVLFGYGSNANFKVESSAPYAFCGNVGAAYNSCSQLSARTHTVTATPFSGAGATGTRGTTYSITFAISTGGSVPVPTPVPTPVTSPPTPPGASPTHSAWLAPVGTPVIAVAAAHLPDGRILFWSSKTRSGFGTDLSTVTWTAIYNPVSGG
jgi:hypothetical protein